MRGQTRLRRALFEHAEFDQIPADFGIRARLAQWVQQYNSGDYAGAASIWAPGMVGVSGGGIAWSS